MIPRFKITAYDAVSSKRMELFTWTRSAMSGIERAKQDAKTFQMDAILSDYQAEPITEWSGSPCPDDPDNFWIDDATGERLAAH